MFELHSIERACARIPGGLKSIKLIDPLDLTVQPKWNVSASAIDLSFKPGKSAYTFQADRLQARLEGETIVSSSAGDYNEYRLTAGIKAIRQTVESLRAKLMGRRIHVVVTYMDDLQRLLPYMRLSAKDDSGNLFGEKQGYSFTGITRLLSPGPGVGGNIATVVPPTVEPGTPEITPGNIATVDITVTTPTHTYSLPANTWLIGWEVRSSVAQTVLLGTSASGNELGGPIDLPALTWWIGNGNQTPSESALNLYFSGLAGTNEIRLWLATA